MYKTLNENASQMSTNTLAKHKTALKSLIMQFMITPISFFPAFVILLTILIPTEYSQRISYWSIMLYPEFVPKFRALREFQYYTLNNWLITFFVLTTFGTAKAAVIVSILVYRMYKTLKENQSRLSSATIARHKTALKSLIMQFMTTPISFFPALVILLTVLIPTEYSQNISYWSLMVGTTHSILNSIVVIITYAEFRKALMFWRRNTKIVATLVPPVKPSGG
ncbi:hypothetical protein B9Z55_028282 [Caenorhabditis nigoni]|uniref:G-protein coupled receptors family 1 profile domain-containing protein n=1 Tax=Caenorhabditis nigoni TaxID=1611254 RepID=A0A2G5SCI0_9PELO|nr:hypothetical protein B9Z55_028282 [Caenorhabditis nigoni]